MHVGATIQYAENVSIRPTAQHSALPSYRFFPSRPLWGYPAEQQWSLPCSATCTHLIYLLPATCTRSQGLDGAVVLSNSVGMADNLRILAALEQRALAAAAAAKAQQPGAAAGGSGAGPAGSVAVGRIMVVKAFLGQTASDSTSIGSK